MARPVNADPDQTRQRLIAAASICFAARGLHGTSLRDVAKHAGVTMATIHYYFGSKQALYDACLAELSGELAAELEPIGQMMRDMAISLVAARHEKRRDLDTLEDFVERAVRSGFRFIRAHRSALPLIMRPVVEHGELEESWRKTVLLPFLGEVSRALAPALAIPEAEVRLRVQSLVALGMRYALSTERELEELSTFDVPLDDRDRSNTRAKPKPRSGLERIEDHLVSLAHRLLGCS